MMFLDTKYLGILGVRFRNFRRIDATTYNWSCHECGDSKKDRRKARAYAYEKKSRMYWCCHNCNGGGSVSDLVKAVDEEMFREYLLERFQHSDRGRELQHSVEREAAFDRVAKSAPVPADTPFDGLQVVSSLPDAHPAKQLVRRRMIPVERWDDLYHTDTFFAWRNRLLPEKDKGSGFEEPRFVIPFRRFKGLVGFQGRSYGPSSAKYISVKLDTERHLIYGWNYLDGVGNVYAVEGPIDSMFLPNGVAVAGGSIHTGLADSGIPKNVAVIVSDNEPRNRQIVMGMMKAAADGWRVCVWPPHVVQKDINDMVLSGRTAEAVQRTIDDNTHHGMAAELAISQWRKISI